jgi:hypothetical protein
VGFVFHPGNPYAGIDFDDICNRDGWDPEAEAEIKALNSYADLSPGGQGAHVIVKVPAKVGADGQPLKGCNAGGREIYYQGRYFTMTGIRLKGTPADPQESPYLPTFVSKHFSPPEPAMAPQEAPTAPEEGTTWHDLLGIDVHQGVEVPGRYKGRHGAAAIVVGGLLTKHGAADALAIAKAWNVAHCKPKPLSVDELKKMVRDWTKAAQVPAKPPGVLCSEVIAEQVTPLWEGHLFLGKIAVLDGDPGTGKSTLTTDLAARVSTGANMPDGTPGGQGGVVVVSLEDGVADTVVPRLMAAGADLTRIVALSSVGEGNAERLISVPEDLPVIEAAAARVGARLIVLDPIMALLSGGVDSHRDQDIRRALAPLARMAERTKAAVVIVRHLNKGGQGSSPLYRGGGSIGIVGAARSGFLVAKDPGNPAVRVLSPTKCNLAAEPPSLQYQLEAIPVDGCGDVVRVRWEGVSLHTAASLLESQSGGTTAHGGSALEEAAAFLKEELSKGPVSWEDLSKKADRQDIARRTMFRVRETGLFSWRCFKSPDDGKWYWEQVCQASPAANSAQLAHMDKSVLEDGANRSVPRVPNRSKDPLGTVGTEQVL